MGSGLSHEGIADSSEALSKGYTQEQIDKFVSDGKSKKFMTAVHTAEYDVSADKIWPVLSDFSSPYVNEANSNGASVEDVVGNGAVGATRKVVMGEANWSEQVTRFDADTKSYSYMCTSALPGPFAVFDISTFVCTLSVQPAGDNKCTITVGSIYTVHEGTDESTIPPITPMYKSWADSIAEFAQATSETAAEFVQRAYSAPANPEWGNTFMTDDCVFIRPSGNPLNKEGFNQMLNNDDIKVESQSVDKILEVREFENGNFAWVSFLSASKFTYKGTANDDLAPISLFLEKTSSGWIIRAGHRAGSIKK